MLDNPFEKNTDGLFVVLFLKKWLLLLFVVLLLVWKVFVAQRGAKVSYAGSFLGLLILLSSLG